MTYAPQDKENSNPQHQHQPAKTTAQTFTDNRGSTSTSLPLQSMMANSPQQKQLKSTAQFMANRSAQQSPNSAVQSFANKSEPLQRMEEDPLQGKFESESTQREAAPEAPRPNNTGLPDNLKSGIENLSGMNMDHVRVHYNSDKPAQLQAHAYAQGNEIHVAPGQEQHLPHEAWHVVQQAQGRVKTTVQMKGNMQVNDDVGLEREADVMGANALFIGAPTLIAQLATQRVTPTEKKPRSAINADTFELVPRAPSSSFGGTIQRVDDSSEDTTGEPEKHINLVDLPKVKKRILIREAAEESKTGNLADRILHEVAVRVSQVFGNEVPLDSRGLPLATLSGLPEAAPTSKNALKKAAKKAVKASGKSSTKKEVVAEPDPLEVARGKLQEEGQGQQLNPMVTKVLIELRKLSRTYLTALLQVSGHSRGKNVFSWCGRDFVVEAKGRYVAPLSNEKIAGKDNLIATDSSYFDDYDYPGNGINFGDYKSIIEDLMVGNQPKVDIKTLTVFIASIGAEISRYEPQIVSVVLAVTGVTADTDDQSSVFADALTMTTGSTDPGSGSHVDGRPAFVGEGGKNRATDVAAIREGAILRAAFSHPELGLDVATYLAQRIGKIEAVPATIADCDDIINDLSQLLIYVMNRKSAKSMGAVTADILKLENYLTEKALTDHFPDDFQFPARSVDNSSIVLLTPGDRVRLAAELSKHDWSSEFRSSQLYDVASKVTKSQDIEYGRANIRLTNQDGKVSAKNGNHWSGHDWAGTPKKMTPKEYEQQIGDKKEEAANEKGPRKAVLTPDARIKSLYALMEAIPQEKQRDLTASLAAIQAALDSTGTLDSVSEQMVLLEKELASSASGIRDILLGSRPSNEWRLMPRTWIRGAASGLGHNCLIDSLLQHVTTLDAPARRREAAAIRLQLIKEGRTTAMAYLGGYEHAARILQLIGVDPAQYEVRTEWTSGGMVQLRESTGTGQHVLRLWNTGGHYEPITVSVNDLLSDDLGDGQTNAQLHRVAIPQWLQTALVAVGDAELVELEKENAEKGDSKKGYEDAGYVCYALDGWTIWSSAAPPKNTKANVFIRDTFDPASSVKTLHTILQKYAMDWKSVAIRSVDALYTILGVQDDVDAPFTFMKKVIGKK